MMIPPERLAIILGFSFGFFWGESFSKFDYQIKYKSKILEKHAFSRWLLLTALDALHHFQYGLALMFVAQLPLLPPLHVLLIYWAGAGLVISDWKDYEYVIKRFSKIGGSGKT